MRAFSPLGSMTRTERSAASRLGITVPTPFPARVGARVIRWAGLAATEAIAKALGTGIGHGVSFQDMIITNNAKGAPEVVLSGGAARIMAEQGAHKVLLSLADERHYAIAYAILLGS